MANIATSNERLRLEAFIEKGGELLENCFLKWKGSSAVVLKNNEVQAVTRSDCTKRSIAVLQLLIQAKLEAALSN
jgi:hypothetical protein